MYTEKAQGLWVGVGGGVCICVPLGTFYSKMGKIMCFLMVLAIAAGDGVKIKLESRT